MAIDMALLTELGDTGERAIAIDMALLTELDPKSQSAIKRGRLEKGVASMALPTELENVSRRALVAIDMALLRSLSMRFMVAVHVC